MVGTVKEELELVCVVLVIKTLEKVLFFNRKKNE